jgi:ATPase family associated with various cellular activities (AAA)
VDHEGGARRCPGELLGGAEYFHGARSEALVRVEGALCQLILQERSLVVRTAARSPEHAEHALRAVAKALPEVDDGDREVSARFWWWTQHGPAELARMLPSTPWGQIDDNYVNSTRLRLTELCRWDLPPAGGRLLLWHGEPGTGKTHAIRTLLGEWRSWAEFQFVTDPESFLSNPGYLLATIGGPQRSRPTGPVNRWRIVVLEDAGEFLAPDAKHLKGQALSRLLNVCDGVLGQAMRALVLVTTNEPIGHLHPALARPGRCLSEIDFERFGRREIIEWCSDRAVAPPDVQAATLAELYAHVDGRPMAQRRRTVGFAPAAA